MYPTGNPKPFDETETQSIIWVSREEANNRICKTRNEVGRKRDEKTGKLVRIAKKTGEVIK